MNKFKEFIYKPFLKIDKEYKSILDRQDAVSEQYEIDKDTKKYLEASKDLLEELDRLNIRNRYKASGNKMNFFMWFVWWSNITVYIFDIYKNIQCGKTTFIIMYISLSTLSIGMIIFTYKLIMKNKKTRDDLFIEGI